jgi:uncharacterized RDD family membrane protein YckC
MDNSTPPSTQRYAPPTAEVADVSTGDAAQLAGRGARLGAVMIDTLILLALWWVVSRISPWNIYSSAMAKAGFLTLVGMTLFGMLMFAAVHGYLLATRGQTVGKMLLGIRITRGDGSPASFVRLVGLRFTASGVLSLVPIVGPLYGLADALMIFRANRRTLHDLIADTIVVKT